MIAAALGAENIPPPTPFKNTRTAKIQYAKFVGTVSRPTKLRAKTHIPVVESVRAPCRSERYPEIGPANKNPTVKGKRKMPAHSGVSE
jgi:hypothetical protein